MQSVAVERDAQHVKAVAAEQSRADRLSAPMKGMDTSKSVGDLAVNEGALVSGLHIVAGKLVVDTGYFPYGSEYRGVAQATFQAFFNNGTSATLLITTTTTYVWAPGSQQWQVVPFGAAPTTTAPYVAGDTDIALSSIAGLADGQVVGVRLDDGSQLITTINGAPGGGHIQLLDPVPIGRTVANGAEVAAAFAFSGDPTRSQISAQVFAATDWIVFSNNIDPVMYYLAGVLAEVPGLPASTTCGAIAVFHECLLLGNLVETGTRYPHRVRMSDLGDPTEWTTGIAAIYNLFDTDDYIATMKTLGPWLIIYRLASVMRASYIGAPNETLFFEYMLTSEGCQSQGAVIDVGGQEGGRHIVVGNNNVYAYQGGYTIEPIGDPIFNNFLSATGNFNAGAKATLFTAFVPQLFEVWIVYPTNNSVLPDAMLRMFLRSGGWFARTFANALTSAGPLFSVSFITWSSAPGKWSDETWARPWSSRTLRQNIPSIALTSDVEGADARILMYDYASPTDNGAVIGWQWTTKQFGDGVEFRRWERAVVLGQGGAVPDDITAEFSQDEGQTWLTLGEWTLGSGSPAAISVPIDISSTRCQLRLTGTTTDFQVRDINIVSIMETEW